VHLHCKPVHEDMDMARVWQGFVEGWIKCKCKCAGASDNN
jgi:hypothetical protein